MAGIKKHLLKVSVIALAIPMMAFGVQKDNPRGAITPRTGATNPQETVSVSKRSNTRQDRPMVGSRSVSTQQNVKSRSVRPAAGDNLVQNRSASTAVRSGTNTVKQTSRANTARATAVFKDVSKIGGGYADCRDAYATCMDQICASANETYRRCYCSDRFTGFRETSEKIDTALGMLADFQNENLDAVDKTAAEVNAMYTASAGEKAIKKDTSASQKLLNKINDVLSGNYTENKVNNLNSLGVLDFSVFNDDMDIWGDEGSSIFGESSASNIADLEGKALYNKAYKQCKELIQDSCSSEAVFDLARNSYSIMISQDCNVLEKNINAKRASLEETVRTAEKYLREARLEEYRAHNSADVIECINKVETALTNPVACGENYISCMDADTGKYINNVTGEPIYSQALFEMNNLIVLNGTTDVLKANPTYDKYLDSKKYFAQTALDSCRDIADTVWHEFKRSALIKIAQAQDEKIQQIKDSCVATIKECYDTQTDTLKDVDDTDMQSTGAISATVARSMCYDRVLACAALYGDPEGCKYDDKTKKISNASTNKKCGLQSLLTFVDTVDSVKVAEGCEVALTKYAHELCDPAIDADEDVVYPIGCATMPRATLRAKMELQTKTFCAQELIASDGSNILQNQSAFNTNLMNQIIQSIYDELGIAFTAGCEDDPEVDGTWVFADEGETPNLAMLNQAFYRKYYGRTISTANQMAALNLPESGWCIVGSVGQQCLALGSQYATWDGSQCNMTEQWYNHYCEVFLEGSWTPSTTSNINHGTCVISDATVIEF